MYRKAAFLALSGVLTIWLVLASCSMAAPPQNKVANLKFSGTTCEEDCGRYLGLTKPGDFTLQDIKAPYVLIEITRTT